MPRLGNPSRYRLPSAPRRDATPENKGAETWPRFSDWAARTIQGCCSPTNGCLAGSTICSPPPTFPRQFKDRGNWPAELLAELGNDEGLSAAQRYGERLADDFRAIRKMLDDFNPDLVLIWGDDQYENFREDIVPAFCLFGLDDQFDVSRGTTAMAASPTAGASRATGH